MIEVRYKGQLGNNLFQYSLGRILAETFGYALQASPIPGFPNTGDVIDGTRVDEPAIVLGGQRAELERLQERLAHGARARVVLDGWFQRHEYYRPHRDAIRRWLAFGPEVRRPAERPETVLHVRRNDYVTNGWALPFTFYEAALDRLAPAEPPWILTDDPRDPFFRRFDRWHPRFTGASVLDDLAFLSSARRIVLSQSTYSWWAAFLGDPETVVCPVPAVGVWSATGEDTSLIERDRFVCLACDAYTPSGREAWYQRRRALRPAVARAVRRVIPVPTLRRRG